MRDDGAGGSHVHFVAQGGARRGRLSAGRAARCSRGVARSFQHYHELLARNVEASA